MSRSPARFLASAAHWRAFGSATGGARLSEDEKNNILGTIGWESGTEDFADLALAAQWRGLQYHVINGDDGTNLIVSEAR